MEVPQPPKSNYRPSLHLLSHYYSLKSTLHYPPDRKLVTAVSSTSRQNVFERLCVRPSLRQSAASAPRLSEHASPRRSRGPGVPPVEEQLLSKARETSEHLTSLRTKYLTEELNELQPAPTINPLSRKIVERLDRERYGIVPAPVVIQAHLPAKEEVKETPRARVPHLAIPQPKPSPPRSLNRSEVNMLRAMMLHGKLSTRTQLGIPPPSDRRPTETEDAVKLATLQSLRSEAMSRFQSEEPELPPDFFSLSFDARSRVFTENRTRKLQQAKTREQVREAQECTFQPIFYARIPHRRLNNTTSELLHLSRERSPVARTPSLTQRIRRSPGYYERYQQRLTDTLRESSREHSSR